MSPHQISRASILCLLYTAIYISFQYTKLDFLRTLQSQVVIFTELSVSASDNHICTAMMSPRVEYIIIHVLPKL